MEENYNPSEIELTAQAQWHEQGTFKTQESSDKESLSLYGAIRKK